MSNKDDIFKIIKMIPSNKNRSRNLILCKNDWFEFVYDLKTKLFKIEEKDIIFSAIPYDKSKKYIKIVTLFDVFSNDKILGILNREKKIIEWYIDKALKQANLLSNKKEIQKQWNFIISNRWFAIQILGRILQDKDTGPLWASLPDKFLFEFNKKTGIQEYCYHLNSFIIDALNQISKFYSLKNKEVINKLENLSIIEKYLKIDYKKQIIKYELYKKEISKPLLKSENANFNKLSKSYKKQTQSGLHYFLRDSRDINPIQINKNKINIVSDIHNTIGKIPFKNNYFNIFAGDIFDLKEIKDTNIKGIYIIGNHELGYYESIFNKRKMNKEYMNEKWWSNKGFNFTHDYKNIPIDSKFYSDVKKELSLCFPKMKILHNESYTKNGIRYVGITKPINFFKKKKASEEFIYKILKKLIGNKKKIPTIIISHAPLFNELSLLSPKSKAYNKNYSIENKKLLKLFETYNILGVIHGHHHIPSSKGTYKIVEFANKHMFVICSIYSELNTGIDLLKIINLLKEIKSNKIAKIS